MRSALARVDVGPVLVDHIADAGPRRGHHVGAGQDVELAAAGQVADVHPIRAGRIGDVDVPVVAAAVDLHVANDGLGRAGRFVAADIEQAEDGPGGVPFLSQGGLGPLHGLAGQLPVGVQPVGVADHDDHAILAVAGRKVLGDLGRQVAGGHANVVLAAFDLFLAGGRGVAGRRPLRPNRDPGSTIGLHQGLDQFFLAHPVPANDALLACHFRQVLLRARLQFVAGHAKRLPHRRRPGRGALMVKRSQGNFPVDGQVAPGRSISGEEGLSEPARRGGRTPRSQGGEWCDRARASSLGLIRQEGEQKKANPAARGRIAS